MTVTTVPVELQQQVAAYVAELELALLAHLKDSTPRKMIAVDVPAAPSNSYVRREAIALFKAKYNFRSVEYDSDVRPGEMPFLTIVGDIPQFRTILAATIDRSSLEPAIVLVVKNIQKHVLGNYDQPLNELVVDNLPRYLTLSAGLIDQVKEQVEKRFRLAFKDLPLGHGGSQNNILVVSKESLHRLVK